MKLCDILSCTIVQKNSKHKSANFRGSLNSGAGEAKKLAILALEKPQTTVRTAKYIKLPHQGVCS